MYRWRLVYRAQSIENPEHPEEGEIRNHDIPVWVGLDDSPTFEEEVHAYIDSVILQNNFPIKPAFPCIEHIGPVLQERKLERIKELDYLSRVVWVDYQGSNNLQENEATSDF